MATPTYTNFPSQVVSDLEKMSPEYGLKIAQAIESEWFGSGSNAGGTGSRYRGTNARFRELRLYARGEQSIQKYKDELSINGDLSYLNLDWKPVPIISKFVDIVVNGMAQRTYDVKAFSQDQYGVSKRTEYMESLLKDMRNKKFNEAAKQNLNVDLFENDPETLPDSEEELQLHMQLNYKQAVEIAEEQAINVLLEGNNFDLINRRLYYDLAVLGMAAVKTTFNFSEGVKIEYVDPANLVYSHTESPYFEDLYYVGEVKEVPINELVKEFPDLVEEDLKKIQSKGSMRGHERSNTHTEDQNKIEVLYFNYKTYTNNVYKLKEVGTGAEKAIEKDDSFNPPENKEGSFMKLQRSVECVFEGAMVVGSQKLLKWRKAENMMRSKSDFNKVKMNYSMVAPRMYQGRIESLVGRITGFADMIQMTHLKLQQVMSRMVPDGIYLDADGLAEIDLGNGTNYSPQEALNMFFQTGSVIGRSFTGDGDANPGKVPIQQIQHGANGGKMQALIGNYNYYLQMIRDVTGLNEARDGSSPDANALVGVQKLAAANSNTATRHILQSGLFLAAEVAEALSLRISDIIEYSPTKDAFIQAIGAQNVATLEEMSELHLYDFGIFLQLSPDEEERQLLENNIQVALGQGLIDLSDAIDLREVKNLKLANQLLKVRRKKKQETEQAIAQQNIEAQAQANAQAQEVAAQAEVQKKQALVESEIQLENAKAEMKSNYLKEEVLMKKQLMDHEFEINMKLRKMELEADNKKEEIKQKNDEQAPKKFESSGNDILGSGIGLDKFAPSI